jgi:hypothetical protein
VKVNSSWWKWRPADWADSTWISFLISTAVWIAAFAFIVIREGIYVDFADGIAHYAMTKYALQDPSIFFNSWARPAHVLFGVLPAQFGYIPYIAAHVAITIATIVLSLELGRRWKVPALWLIPWWITVNRAVLYVTLAGLTESLFLFIVMLALLGLERQMWKSTAVLLGAALFSRPEALLLVVLGVLWMVAKAPRREIWILIACVLSVPVVMYLVENWLSHDDLVWKQSEFPIRSILNVYGSGDWTHFYQLRHKWASTPLIFGGFLATILLVIRAIAKQIQIIHFVLVYVWGVVIVHSFLWHFGLMGSLGLPRILAVVIPPLALLLHFSLGSKRLVPAFLTLLFIAHSAELIYHQSLRFERSPQQVLAQHVAEWIKIQNPNLNWSAQWSMPIVLADLPSEDTGRIRRLWTLPPLRPSSYLNPGEFLLWDNITGFREGGIDQAVLDRDPNLSLARIFRYKNLEVRAYEVVESTHFDFHLSEVVPFVSGIGVWERSDSASLRIRPPKKLGRIIGLPPSVQLRTIKWEGDSTGTLLLKHSNGHTEVLGSKGHCRIKPLSKSITVLWRSERGAVLHQFDLITNSQPEKKH